VLSPAEREDLFKEYLKLILIEKEASAKGVVDDEEKKELERKARYVLISFHLFLF
jgi:hypothetical protein